MWDSLKEILSSTDSVAVLISAISTLSAIITIVISQKHYKADLEPQLSMNLIVFNSFLYLCVKNTGKTAAKCVRIHIKALRNNGSNSSLLSSEVFDTPFELYPDETVQACVAVYGKTISEQVFPSVDMSVAYLRSGYRRSRKYNRSITMSSEYGSKIYAAVAVDTKSIESSLTSISRATVRTANYLDGRQVANFDELNILAGTSLKNDLQSVYGQPEGVVLSREDTIKEALSNRHVYNTEKQSDDSAIQIVRDEVPHE